MKKPIVRIRSFFTRKRDCDHDEVKERLSKVTKKDYVRVPKRSSRQQLTKRSDWDWGIFRRQQSDLSRRQKM